MPLLTLEGKKAFYSPILTIEQTTRRNSEFKKYLQKAISGNDVVELGSGLRPQYHLLSYFPKSYTCVDHRYAPIEVHKDATYVRSGAISFLRSLQANSSTFVSSGFIASKGFGRDGIQEIVELLFRKTQHNGQNVHTVEDGFETLLVNSSFKFAYACMGTRSLSKQQMIEGYTKPMARSISPISVVVQK